MTEDALVKAKDYNFWEDYLKRDEMGRLYLLRKLPIWKEKKGILFVEGMTPTLFQSYIDDALSAQPHDAEALAVAIEGLKDFQGPRDVLRERLKLLTDYHPDWDDIDRIRFRNGIDVAFAALSAQPHDAEGQRVLKEIEAKVEALPRAGNGNVVRRDTVLAIIREAMTREGAGEKA